MTATPPTAAPPTRGLAGKLYHGETAFDFVGRRSRWFALSGAIIVIGLLALGVRGLNFGIDFKGGTNWEVPANGLSVVDARAAVAKAGVSAANVQTVKSNSRTDIRVQANVKPADVINVTTRLAEAAKTTTDKVSVNSVGPTWGHDISQKAIRALIAFFIAVFVFIALRFQWKMALAAIVAVIHDILVTVGVYAIFGFDVTPATVIAILTILGYSLYDTVVVFDKVDENTKGLAASGRMTYSDTVNLSMNQVLMRSLNTSLVAILPIASVLLVGDIFLGATTLKEFGLALFVGLITGAYSSIFIAAPILAILKEREPRYATIRQRLESRGSTGNLLTPRAAAEASGGGGSLRSTGTATAVLDDADDDGDGGVLRPGGGGGGAGTTARTSRPAGSAGARPARPGVARAGGPRPAPRGRKKPPKRR